MACIVDESIHPKGENSLLLPKKNIYQNQRPGYNTLDAFFVTKMGSLDMKNIHFRERRCFFLAERVVVFYFSPLCLGYSGCTSHVTVINPEATEGEPSLEPGPSLEANVIP